MIVRVQIVDNRHFLANETLHEAITNSLSRFIERGIFAFLVSDTLADSFRVDMSLSLDSDDGHFVEYDGLVLCASALRKVFGKIPKTLYIGFPSIRDFSRHGAYRSVFTTNTLKRKR